MELSPLQGFIDLKAERMRIAVLQYSADAYMAPFHGRIEGNTCSKEAWLVCLAFDACSAG